MRTRSAAWTPALLATLLAACATSTGDAPPLLTGRYEAHFVDQGKPQAVTLACSDETHCTFSIAAGPPIETTDAHSITDPKEARFALGYAVEHADARSQLPDDAFLDSMAPLLHAAPEIATCWDLQDHGYLLACRLRAGGRPDPRMFVFATVLAGCGPRSCRYMIIPLDEKPR